MIRNRHLLRIMEVKDYWVALDRFGYDLSYDNHHGLPCISVYSADGEHILVLAFYYDLILLESNIIRDKFQIFSYGEVLNYLEEYGY